MQTTLAPTGEATRAILSQFSTDGRGAPSVEIPNRALFKAAEVCDLVKVQPYVLRSWEAEFPELGVAKSAGGPRFYRRIDVEQVVRIKHLLLVEGLTLAGARRKLQEEATPIAADAPVIDELIGRARARAADRGQARTAIDPRAARRPSSARLQADAPPMRMRGARQRRRVTPKPTSTAGRHARAPRPAATSRRASTARRKR